MNHTVLHIVFQVYSRLVLGHYIGVCKLGLPKFPVAHLYWDAALLLASLGLPKRKVNFSGLVKLFFSTPGSYPGLPALRMKISDPAGS